MNFDILGIQVEKGKWEQGRIFLKAFKPNIKNLMTVRINFSVLPTETSLSISMIPATCYNFGFLSSFLFFLRICFIALPNSFLLFVKHSPFSLWEYMNC